MQAMVRHLGAGVSAGEAARLVLAAEAPPAGLTPSLEGVADELREALDDFDDARAQVVLDLLITRLGFDALARDVLLPYLHELGDARSAARPRLRRSISRAWCCAGGWSRWPGAGTAASDRARCWPARRASATTSGCCCSGSRCARRWRITYLGPDTPIDTLTTTAADLAPDAVVIVALTPARLAPLREPLAQLAQRTRLLLAGAGVHADLADAVGAELLHGDPVEAAAQLRP